MAFQKPFLPECFLHWTEPPGESGDEVLRIVSWRRSLTLKGHSFREFSREVIPLLDGKHSLDEICEEVEDLFDRPALEAALDMLGQQGIVVEGNGDISGLPESMTPQLGWLAEAAPEGRQAQKRLSDAHVVFFGAGAHGACAARSLTAAGIGKLTIVDPGQVAKTDSYFSGLYRDAPEGRNRADCLADALAATDSETQITAMPERPDDAGAIAALIEGASLVLCCLESGELNLALKLNKACHGLRMPWIAASMEGIELVVGPGFFGREDGPCYMCWRMREVAASANPQSRFALERRLDRLQSNLSPKRENLVAGADIVGGMLAAEAVSVLSGASEPNLDGRFLVVEIPGLGVEKHSVLRKPGCPVCGGGRGAPA